MAIPGISDVLLQTAFVSSPAEGQSVGTSSKKRSKTDAFYIASMTLYLTILHELIMNSWQKFAETQKENAEENDANYRIHEQLQAQLEGQRKRAEALKQEEEGELVRCGVHRQAGKLHFHEGSHFGEGFDHRHLHIAV